MFRRKQPVAAPGNILAELGWVRVGKKDVPTLYSHHNPTEGFTQWVHAYKAMIESEVRQRDEWRVIESAKQ